MPTLYAYEVGVFLFGEREGRVGSLWPRQRPVIMPTTNNHHPQKQKNLAGTPYKRGSYQAIIRQNLK